MAGPMQSPMQAARPQTQQQSLPRMSRMNLKSLVTGRQLAPIRVVIHGVDGVGKSTFGAAAPNAVFIGAEDGTSQLDVARFPSPESWSEVLEAIQELTVGEHSFQTVVIDSLDWAEPLCWAHVCKKGNKESIEEFGYGKGYVAALDEWRIFLSALERLRKAKGMHVVLIAHSVLRTFKNPTDEDFDRYQLKLHEKTAGLIREWADAVLFASYEVLAAKDGKTNRVRGVSTGARLVHTTHNAAWDAKNRYSLPEELPLSWDDFFAAVRSGRVADPAALRAECERKAAELGGELGQKATDALGRAGDDTNKLAQLNDWLNAQLQLHQGGSNEQ